MNTKCQVFTPLDYVEKLLDTVGYTSNLYGKRILENSCGDGNILVAIVTRYITDCKANGLTNIKIKHGLEKDIVGYEIDPKHYATCIKNLNQLADTFGIKSVKWGIYNEDYLRDAKVNTFEYVVGNPPYITYSEIKPKEQEYLRTSFSSCAKGKFDYCYAFIEKSLSELSRKGKMSYLIPSSIFKTVFGKKLRDIMKPYISGIVEYTQIDVFDEALVKSAIIYLDKSQNSNELNYSDGISSKMVSVKSLSDKWMFSDCQEGTRRFGDYFKVSHVVATLLNRAFVLEDGTYQITENGISVGGHLLENEVVKDTETPRTKQFDKNELIIFPYSYRQGKLYRYSEEEFEKNFPGVVRYLSQYKEELAKRKSDDSAKWFEYGRSQALNRLNSEKLLISTVISSEVEPYLLPEECIPYAGMFITPIQREDEMTLGEAYEILKSKEFFEYVQNIGIHINGNSVRVTSKDIENFSFKER